MGRNIGKKIIKNLSSKYSQKSLDYAKQSATDALKTASKRAIQKTAEATDLIGSKITNTVLKSYDDRITKVSKTSQQMQEYIKNLRIRTQSSFVLWKTVINGHDKEIPKERYISPEERKLLMI